MKTLLLQPHSEDRWVLTDCTHEVFIDKIFATFQLALDYAKEQGYKVRIFTSWAQGEVF